MKLIVIEIEPASSTECGDCPKKTYSPEGFSAPYCDIFKRHVLTEYGKSRRTEACLEAERRLRERHLNEGEVGNDL